LIALLFIIHGKKYHYDHLKSHGKFRSFGSLMQGNFLLS